MRQQRGFLEDPNGDKSNSRLIADILIGAALIFQVQFILIGVFKPLIDLMAIATAIGVIFGSIAGSALVFLFGQKWTESKQEKIQMEYMATRNQQEPQETLSQQNEVTHQ